jgi:hypothetical protein
MKFTGTSIFNIRHSLFDIALILFALWGDAFAQGKYQTLGPSGCGIGQDKCHATENGQMIKQHKNSATSIADGENSQKYADALGVKEFLQSPQCMNCHGTIISGKEGKEVEEGVSCESCHGAGSGYKDPHSEGPKGSEGQPRPGYTKSLALGLADLKKPEEIAKACVRCHYTTDQRLISAGHPDGAKFAYKSKMKDVAEHWRYRDKKNVPEGAVFKAAMDRRAPGAKFSQTPKPVAQQAPAQPPVKSPAPTPQKPTPQSVDVTAPPLQKQNIGDQPAPTPRVRKPPPPPTPVAADRDADPPPTPAELKDLPPFPAITESTRVDRMLLLLKKRLELLYTKTKN